LDVLAALTIFSWIRLVATLIWVMVLLWIIKRELTIEFNLYKFKKAYSRGDADHMEKFVGRILKIRPNDLYGLACKGLVYDIRGQDVKALEIGDRILGLAKKKKKKKWQAYALNFLGFFYLKHDDLEKAEQMIKEALRISAKSNNKDQMSSSYDNLGIIYTKREKWENAEEMFDKAITLLSDKDVRELAGIYCHFGISLRMRGDLIEAEKILNKALEINEKYCLSGQLAINYAEIATVCVLKGEIEKGQELYEKSLTISESKGMIKLSATQYCSLGDLYKKMGNKEKAKEYWFKAKCLYEKMELTSEVEKIQQLIDDSEFE
jgi:protein O-GlcNAc transferase